MCWKSANEDSGSGRSLRSARLRRQGVAGLRRAEARNSHPLVPSLRRLRPENELVLVQQHLLIFRFEFLISDFARSRSSPVIGKVFRGRFRSIRTGSPQPPRAEGCSFASQARPLGCGLFLWLGRSVRTVRAAASRQRRHAVRTRTCALRRLLPEYNFEY